MITRSEILKSFLLLCGAATLALGGTKSTAETDSMAVEKLEYKAIQFIAVQDWYRINTKADDATILLSNMPIFSIEDNVNAALRSLDDDENFTWRCRVAPPEVSPSGEMAYTRGSCSIAFSDLKTKRPIVDNSEFLIVYRKQSDGSWVIIENMTKSDLRPAAADEVFNVSLKK